MGNISGIFNFNRKYMEKKMNSIMPAMHMTRYWFLLMLPENKSYSRPFPIVCKR